MERALRPIVGRMSVHFSHSGMSLRYRIAQMAPFFYLFQFTISKTACPGAFREIIFGAYFGAITHDSELDWASFQSIPPISIA